MNSASFASWSPRFWIPKVVLPRTIARLVLILLISAAPSQAAQRADPDVCCEFEVSAQSAAGAVSRSYLQLLSGIPSNPLPKILADLNQYFEAHEKERRKLREEQGPYGLPTDLKLVLHPGEGTSRGAETMAFCVRDVPQELDRWGQYVIPISVEYDEPIRNGGTTVAVGVFCVLIETQVHPEEKERWRVRMRRPRVLRPPGYDRIDPDFFDAFRAKTPNGTAKAQPLAIIQNGPWIAYSGAKASDWKLEKPAPKSRDAERSGDASPGDPLVLHRKGVNPDHPQFGKACFLDDFKRLTRSKAPGILTGALAGLKKRTADIQQWSPTNLRVLTLMQSHHGGRSGNEEFGGAEAFYLIGVPVNHSQPSTQRKPEPLLYYFVQERRYSHDTYVESEDSGGGEEKAQHDFAWYPCSAFRWEDLPLYRSKDLDKLVFPSALSKWSH
ncbi:MAG: hypothetical protein RLZZ244_1518 [Verrucomicrobiota bacterium]